MNTETYLAQALIAPRKYVTCMAANAATIPGQTIRNMPFAVDAEIVCDAMIAAGTYGRAFRESALAK